MEIDIGSAVECVDGGAGKVTGLVVERDSKRLVGLVVSKGWIAPEDIVVPMEVVRNVDPSTVYLRLTVRELEEEYHKVKETDYAPVGDDWELPPPDSPEELVVTSIPAVGSEPPLVPMESDLRHPFLLRELTNIPKGASELTKKTGLMCADGPVGELERILFDPTTNRATHLVARLHSKPHLLVAVPIYLVTQIEDTAIHLKALRAYVESLPASPEVGS